MAISKVTLEQLKGIDFTKTALEDVKQELIDFITQHPEYSELWDNFYDSDSGKMILDTFAYLARKLLLRIDITANECFPSTAQQPSSVIKVLKLLGYELRPKSQAQVYINVAFPEGRPEAEIELGSEYALPTTDTEGNAVTFYLRNGASDYFDPVKIPLALDGKAKSGLILKAFSGELKTDTIDRADVNTQDGEIYTLNEYPVVQDSIRVFYIDTDGDRVECVETDSFFNVPFDADYVTYIIHYDENSGAYIEFGDADLVQVLPDNADLQIYYCTGGGVSHNVVENSINITDTFVVPDIIFVGDVPVTFNNPGKGFGGKENETVDEAKLSAPLSLRTINRAVTEQDYEILLQQQGSILHSRVLSPNSNIDYFPNDAKIPLFHVWIYCTLNKQINSMDDLLLTKQVNADGKLIGGDVYDILEFLRVRRIVGIENVIKPSVYTRLFFRLTVEYNQYIDISQIETDLRDKMEELYQLANRPYGKTIRLNNIISSLKEGVNGVVDVTVEFMKRRTYNQLVDVISSPLYFRWDDETPELIEVKDADTDLPTNYATDYNEIAFMLDKDNDIELDFIAVEQ